MRSLMLTISVLVCYPTATIGAQSQTATVRIQVRASEKPVEDAEVVVAGTTHRTGADGTTTIVSVPGTIDITVLKPGFAPTTASVQVAAGATQVVVVELQAQPTVEETVTVVASTRTDKRLEDQPMRVEVLARDEIEEKMLMTPGDIVMMLNEMGGMRVQATSPSLGAASVRIQGMRGRYTRVLSDGLPLFGEVGGLGLLQIPPMDLGQVEVIKGVASALYGAGAMGGVINLLSRRPGREPEQEFLLNRSTRGATDAVTFLSGPCLAAGVPRCWVAATGRKRTTSMMMLGQICRGMGELWCGPACSGTVATGGHSLPRPGSRTRTAMAALPMVKCLRPLASRTWKPLRPSGSTRAPSVSSCSRAAMS